MRHSLGVKKLNTPSVPYSNIYCLKKFGFSSIFVQKSRETVIWKALAKRILWVWMSGSSSESSCSILRPKIMARQKTLVCRFILIGHRPSKKNNATLQEPSRVILMGDDENFFETSTKLQLFNST